jgi:ectoine hydroxylase-related dioxygenase (phytanoyl-CoA dioxygenase family)
MIANYLAEHPEGVLPTGLSFTPSTSTFENHPDDPGYWSHLKEIKRCNDFVEITGEVGDVVLMHPLMLHSASKNHLRIPRVITNPPVSLREPFNFNRENPDDYSIVERKTLRELGKDNFDFKITTERRRIVPKRLIEAQRMREEEAKRLAALRAREGNINVESTSKPIAVA